MNPFAYERPGTTAAALAVLRGNPCARFIAGGTNVLDLMKLAVEKPPLLVDINRLPLAAIERGTGGLTIGALARMSDVAAHPDVRALFPLVSIALEESASPQLRNMASIGGNLLQRTRCPYFRDIATACNKRVPGSGCSALDGDNRREAILGTSDACIAAHPSDLAVALAVLDPIVHVTGAGASRDIAYRDLYRLPGTTPHLEHTLRPGELITGVTLPLAPPAIRSTYLKVRDRAQYEFALTSAAVVVELQGVRIGSARVALGGVGTVPWRSSEAERVLAGASLSRAAFEAAADAALLGARGHGQNDFKIALAKRTLVRALETVTA